MSDYSIEFLNVKEKKLSDVMQPLCPLLFSSRSSQFQCINILVGPNVCIHFCEFLSDDSKTNQLSQRNCSRSLDLEATLTESQGS